MLALQESIEQAAALSPFPHRDFYQLLEPYDEDPPEIPGINHHTQDEQEYRVEQDVSGSGGIGKFVTTPGQIDRFVEDLGVLYQICYNKGHLAEPHCLQ